jgi:hypothetical protein
MREWKDINERLVREHGEEFRFGYVLDPVIADK